MFNNIYAFVEAAGLDPYCGVYHDIQYGHPALVSDLMEEFRAAVADSLIITLINRKQIGRQHFETADDKIKFTKEGMSVFFEQYRRRINEKVMYKKLKLTYLQIMKQQIWHFMRFLKGEDQQYSGFTNR